MQSIIYLVDDYQRTAERCHVVTRRLHTAIFRAERLCRLKQSSHCRLVYIMPLAYLSSIHSGARCSAILYSDAMLTLSMKFNVRECDMSCR